MQLINSPISSFIWHDRCFFVKRDELLHPDLGGNKARKLAYLLADDYKDITTVISYGGVQSNFMVALATIAKLKHWQFIYYAYDPAEIARLNPQGNLASALANGMQLKIIPRQVKLADYVKQQILPDVTEDQLFIPQGGATIEAQFGLKQLANELKQFANLHGFKQMTVFIASGTGASALYLQKYLPLEYQVYTTNCVGSAEYLQQQWSELDPQFNQHSLSKPIIIPNQKFTFAKPQIELWEIWHQVSQVSQIEFDLVYDPVAWYIIQNNLTSLPQPLIYIHCGGLSGNPTMLSRYKYYLIKQQHLSA
jgi:1-aminocyclopropane-1-carboxylate deaminase/D-cysteine desulfhydrase-like pyridoxal-dependent ACC family enzyme